MAKEIAVEGFDKDGVDNGGVTSFGFKQISYLKSPLAHVTQGDDDEFLALSEHFGST